MKHHAFASSNAEYKLEPVKVGFGKSFWRLTWESNLGAIQLSSLGTPVLSGHLIPTYEDAKSGMKAHVRSMGGGKVDEIE